MTQASNRTTGSPRRSTGVRRVAAAERHAATDVHAFELSAERSGSADRPSGSRSAKVPMTAATRKGFEQLLERLQKPAQPGV